MACSTPTLFPPTLETLAAAFLGLTGGVARSDALYVVAGGGNNARDALDAIGVGADPGATIGNAATTYAKDIGTIVGELLGAGAKAKDIVGRAGPRQGSRNSRARGGRLIACHNPCWFNE
jgi:hypothetical protein